MSGFDDVPLDRYAADEFTAPIVPVRSVPDDEATQLIPVFPADERIPAGYDDERPTTVLQPVRAAGLSPEQDQLLARLTGRQAGQPGGGRRGQATGRRVGRPRRGRRRVLLRAAVTAVAFTVTLVLTGAAIAGALYTKYNSQLTRVQVLQRHDPNIRDAARQQKAENFLVIGSDSRAGLGRKYGIAPGARSDTTMVVHISPDHTKATIISIPRDSWVSIPKCRNAQGQYVAAHSDMFNSAFSIGGAACTIATVQKLTGIAVTHFVEINFSGFQAMVNALGKVTVCSPQTVNDKGSGLHLHPGNNALGGKQALAYVRARESLGDGSDLGRIKRQQMFLGAVLRQAMSGPVLTNPARLTAFLDAATKAITIDRDTTFGDLRTLASSLHGLDPKHVTFYTAPIADPDYSPPGTSMTGRVLLDAAKGRVLYDSVIQDKKPVWVTGSGDNTTVVNGPDGTAAPSPSPSSTTSVAVKPNLTAAQHTCSL